jgi:hypothetical protein
MAGPKSKIANLIEELLAEVPDIARRWFESLNFPEGVQAHLLTPEYVKKLKNLANEFPEGFRQYEPLALHEVIDEAAAGYSDIAIMNPGDFRMLASRNIEDAIQAEADWLAANPGEEAFRAGSDEHIGRINRYAEMFEQGELFDEVPFLEVETGIADEIAQIIGHEGRHRKRALEKIGAGASLVRLIPRSGRGAYVPNPTPVSKMDPNAVLHTELSSMQSGEEGGGKAYKSVGDVLKFLSLGALGGLYDGPIETGYLNNGS